MLVICYHQRPTFRSDEEAQVEGIPTFSGDIVCQEYSSQQFLTRCLIKQSYLFFWDKLNKANYYLELSIELADRPLDDRLVSHLAGDLVSDGGQFDMAVNLLENYGVVPQALYPESTHSSLSSPLNALLKTKLREHALVLRALSSDLKAQALSPAAIQATLRAEKEKLMKEIYTIMTATLGVPPMPDKQFVWEYYDADGKAGRWEGTPIEFLEKNASKPYPVGHSCLFICITN